MAQYAPYTASPEWHPALANQHRSNILSHSKRKAEEDFESQSHISSHFKKLRLNQNHANQPTHATAHSQTYTPQHHYPAPAVPSPPSSTYNLHHAQPSSPTISFRPHIANTDARPALAVAPPPTPPQPQSDPVALDRAIHTHDFAFPPSAPHSTPTAIETIKPPTLADTDFMTIDDTPHRVIIHDLSSEIAQIEAEEAAHNATLFLPDIDKKVSTLPHHLLQQGQNHDRHGSLRMDLDLGRPPAENLNTALVLYRDPSSISVPEEEDVVRKTIIEARRRAREKAAEEQRERERHAREAETRALQEHWDDGMVDHSFQDAGVRENPMDSDSDPDAMEIE
ncbi:hypothetical protein G647_02678 [Cladophialophora carrionii CBS 160.54]|uniref:Uncharacterized protein n=1 Tax=Cladophialophora carrionii CBS 160.54 TaxID=1279043 RepID=V9DGW2_9EURO|nr:uncharacterized protein G647_02678 [Cladophialophora carrionii CBS 160.54]ETI25901.1 hypothetical protein G647_02678 [Cladophialophora carrionii CBS 160.54]